MSGPGADGSGPNEAGADGPASDDAGSDDAESEGPDAADSSAPDPADSTTPDDAPRSLHPLTVAYQLGSTVVRIGVVVVFAGVGGISALLDSGRPLVLAGVGLAVLVLVGATVGYAVVAYRRFEYRLGPETFDIREGVLSRREREIPLRRIQNVDVSQRLPERLLGIAEVRLETAGGGATEAKLRFVGVDEADRLRAEISRLRRRSSREPGAPDASDDPPVAAEPDPIFSISDRELAVLALVSVDPRVLSILAVAASLFVPSMSGVGGEPFLGGPERLLTMLFGPLATLGALVAFALGAGVLSAARYYDFTLTRDAEELRYERGLLQRYSGTIPLSKVQSLTVESNVLARALGYASLTIETAGYAPGSNGGEGSQSAVPLASRDRAMALADSIEDPGVDSLERPPKRARTRYVVRYSLVVAGVAGVLWLVGLVWAAVPVWYYALLLAPLAPLAAHLRWANLGYALGADHVVTQNGFWVRKRRVVPYHRVQTVFTSESAFQRRRDLGTVIVDTAGSSSLFGGDAKAIDVDAETVARLRESIPSALTASLARRRATGEERGVSAARDARET